MSTFKFVFGQNVEPATTNLFNQNTIDAFFGLGTGGLFHAQLNLCCAGDINNDQSIDILDVLIVVDILLGADVPDSQFLESDLNNDNEITINDIVILIGIILEN